jgi:hypothetical protein
MPINILKSFKYKHLLTLNMFLNKTKVLTLSIAKDYCKELSQPIKREDFIPYNMKNEFIKDHKPLFKDWVVCNETSDVKTKVAKLVKNGRHYRIYFNTKEGAYIMSDTNSCDHAKYNDLAIFFEGKLELS